MKTPQELAVELSERHKQEHDKTTALLHNRRLHEGLLEKTEELKLAQVVQTKLLTDKLGGLLEELLQHLQSQKPEIPKHELFAGIDEVITNVKKLGEVLPKELKALGKVIDKPKEEYWTEERLEKVLRKVQPEFPDVVIPEPLAEVRVTNQDKVISLLEKIVKKPDFEKAVVNLPDPVEFPSSMSVDNLGEVVDKLEILVNKSEQPVEQPIGLSWDEDANGNLESVTEIYPSGKVVSTGWNIGRVKVKDDRTN